MTINLHTKYSSKIVEAFKKESVIKGLVGNDYDFVGDRTIKVSTLQTVAMSDYDRNSTSDRYGAMQEVQDTIQEMTMSQDKCFKLSIDKGNQSDQQNIKEAGKVMALQLREQTVPTMDAYVLLRLALQAGKINSSGTALTKTTVLPAILAGTTHMDDAEVPENDRVLLVSNTIYALLKQSTEFTTAVEALSEKTITKGFVGYYDGMKVVKVPSGRWPAYVNFMIVYKNAAINPVKIHETRIKTDSENISGSLLLGRFYYDAFVLGTRANGIYVDVCTATNNGTVCVAPTVTYTGGATDTIAITTSTSDAVIKYTLDGTDPRYSPTAFTYSSALSTASDDAGKVYNIKAYAYKAGTGIYPSGVTSEAVTVSAS